MTRKARGDRLTVYFAASLFTPEERKWNAEVARLLGAALPGAEVILPQAFEYQQATTPGAIFRSCLAGIDAADVVVAVLDGQEADSGTCFEVGYAVCRGIPVVGLRTDYRQNQDRGLNLMLRHACAGLVNWYSFAERPAGAVADLRKTIGSVLRSARRRMPGGSGPWGESPAAL